jgi:hypothetical protein
MAFLKRSWPLGAIFAPLALILILAPFNRAQAPAAPGQASAATGSITILLNGKVIGAAPVLNLQAAPTTAVPSGVLGSCQPNAVLNSIDCNFNINSVFAASIPQVQAGLNVCAPAGGTPSYACLLPGQALGAYTLHMPIWFVPDVSCVSSCTVQMVASLPPVSIKQSDGVTDPGGALIGGRGYWIWYDGMVFRIA